MLNSLFRKLAFWAPKRKPTYSTIRLEVVAQQVKEFNEAKKEINTKITTLQDKTTELDRTISKTLEMTRDNQHRLNSIEENLQKLLDMSEALVKGKPAQSLKSQEPKAGPTE
jgi:uncharacterized phage infection (PIP) family protein YhgE